ncbi:MAG: hypothetical protein QG564_1851 [Campylobacterota bacterium]|nr:hypothetical protein [Campylobacterota bacterium]
MGIERKTEKEPKDIEEMNKKFVESMPAMPGVHTGEARKIRMI